jgi:hypothetical protein
MSAWKPGDPVTEYTPPPEFSAREVYAAVASLMGADRPVVVIIKGQKLHLHPAMDARATLMCIEKAMAGDPH